MWIRACKSFVVVIYYLDFFYFTFHLSVRPSITFSTVFIVTVEGKNANYMYAAKSGPQGTIVEPPEPKITDNFDWLRSNMVLNF